MSRPLLSRTIAILLAWSVGGTWMPCGQAAEAMSLDALRQAVVGMKLFLMGRMSLRQDRIRKIDQLQALLNAVDSGNGKKGGAGK